ncbi:hypothetical protein FGIG_08885 [Fasciola gigantica]|uniref:BHLH domain-containing protein n=1 Tax=Fasciola gigantica TaxID=46835 RepID=A0A504YN52_FASGI|nr:hypothetical protein FGIG_08885 [Fasciola gigantica]
MAYDSFTQRSGMSLYIPEVFSPQTVVNPKRTKQRLRYQANLRERKRMRLINAAFAGLSVHLPLEWIRSEQTRTRSRFLDESIEWPNPDNTSDFLDLTSGQKKGLSKVEILRLAIHYIQSLYELLSEMESPMLKPTILTSDNVNRTYDQLGKLICYLPVLGFQTGSSRRDALKRLTF